MCVRRRAPLSSHRLSVRSGVLPEPATAKTTCLFPQSPLIYMQVWSYVLSPPAAKKRPRLYWRTCIPGRSADAGYQRKAVRTVQYYRGTHSFQRWITRHLHPRILSSPDWSCRQNAQHSSVDSRRHCHSAQQRGCPEDVPAQGSGGNLSSR